MKRIQLSIEEISTTILGIGFEGEQNHTRVVIYCTTLINNYPNAVATMTIKAPTGDVYPGVISQEGNVVTWDVSASNCAIPGEGQYQLTFTDGDEIIKTYIGQYRVLTSLVGSGETPSPVDDWVTNANEALAEIPGRVKNETDDWLEENITNPDSPPLDRSLSSSAAAAPADMVGDLKRVEKAPVITDTVENADIATFTDGADGMYLHNLVVGIDPVQDLNGQAYPYPPGGGKNKLPNRFNPTNTWYGVTITRNNDGTYTLNGTSTRNSSFDFYFNSEDGYVSDASALELPVGDYKFSGITGGSSSTYRMYVALTETGQSPSYVGINDGDGSFSVTSGKKVGVFFRIYPEQSFNNMKIYPMIRLATEDNTFAPYENICPITGWTGANVTRAGKNLASNAQAASLGNNWQYYKTSGLRLKAGTYTLSMVTDVAPSFIYVRPFGKTSEEIAHNNSKSVTFILAEEQIVWFDSYWVGGTGKPSSAPNIQLEVGSTASEYEPYQGTVYPISWQDEAGTVYGGTVDPVTGVLTRTFAEVDLGSLTWTYNTQGTQAFMQAGGLESVIKKPTSSSDIANIICSFLNAVSAYSIYTGTSEIGIGIHTNGVVRAVYPNMPTDPTAFKTAITGQKLVYELATPVEVQLDPVAVATLLGVNNIYADTGAIQSVTYPADTKLYIDKRIAALGGN